MDDNANTTQPNAYWMEAAEKRQEAVALNAAADELESKAKELEKALKTDSPDTPAVKDNVQTEDVTETEDKPKKGFGKK